MILKIQPADFFHNWVAHALTQILLVAVAVVRGDSNVKGVVTFEQSSESSPTSISWDITGNDANAERGMHVHQFGDNTNGCTSAGPHCVLPSPPIFGSFLHEDPVSASQHALDVTTIIFHG